MQFAPAIGSRPLALANGIVRRCLLVSLALMVVGALLIPVVVAKPAPLTSDESLYLAEAYNMATGRGPRYPTGELVNHRAPLYPALLAVPIVITGDPNTAYWVPKLAVVALTAVTFVLVRDLFGALAGAAAASLVAANAFLRWLGGTLFLDGVETLFLLLFLWASWRAFDTGRWTWWAGAGLAFSCAFLTKEAAIQWLPLPLAYALLSDAQRHRRAAKGLAIFYGLTGVALAGWWAWVYAITDRVYFWGHPDERLGLWLGVSGVALAGTVFCWATLLRFAPSRLPAFARLVGLALVGTTLAVIFYHMEYRGGWPAEHDYVRTIPRYLWKVAAPDSAPWPLVTVSIVWLGALARRNGAARILALALVLYVPFALLVANRWLQQRDLLPMMYVAYAAVGGLVATTLRWLAERGAGWPAAGIAVLGFGALALGQTQLLFDEQVRHDPALVTQDNWDNPLVRDTAVWIHENVPAGAAIMASRLYSSHLYVLDRGAHPIHQLPTVRVEPRPGQTPFLRSMSTMFRWEDHLMREPEPNPRWLYLVRYPVKQYYIALSEQDLLHEIARRRIDYLVLTGEDAGYSSLAYLDYFLGNPGFSLIHRDYRSPGNALYVFRVDRTRVSPRPYRAVVDDGTLLALARQAGWSTSDVARAIDPDGVSSPKADGGAS